MGVPGLRSGRVVAVGRRQDIQGLRAIAVLIVVLFHARLPIPGGFTGVDVFFVISGFVITGMLARQRATGGVSFRSFYLRRFMRLTPALAVVVAFVMLASMLLLSPFGPQQTAAATGIGSLLFSANFVIARAAGDYFAVTATQNPLLHTWSLSVEEQFYLFFPALIVGAWGIGRRRPIAVPFAILGVVSAISLLLSALWTNGSTFASGLTDFFSGPDVFAFYGPFTRIWEFGAGVLLALILVRGHAPGRRLSNLAGVVGSVLILVAAFWITEAMPFPGTVALIPVIGTTLVILAGSGDGSFVSRILSTRPLVWVGDISYSWYLWHWPLIVFIAVVLPGHPTALVFAAVFSLLPAWLSYRFVEQPLRGLRPKTGWRTFGTIVTTSGVPIALSAALLFGAANIWGGGTVEPVAVAQTNQTTSATTGTAATAAPDPGDEPTQELTAGTDKWDLRNKHAAVAAGCVNADVDGSKCRFGPADAKGTILVLGDSEAYALGDGVIEAASSLGYDTVISSRTGCPFLGRESSGSHDIPCGAWQKSALAYALESRPAAVVIANRSAGYVHPELDWRTAATDAGKRATTVKEAASLWREGLADVIEPLHKAGIPVVILTSVAQMPDFTDQRSLFAQAFGAQAYEVPLDKVVAEREPALDVEMSIAADYPGTVVFDPLPFLCTDICSSAVDGVLYYEDETHLTLEGAQQLTPGLIDALSKAVTPAS